MPPIVLDGTTGITTPGLTNTGTETLVNLTTTGNTTLGDASTDTLNVGNGGLVKDASGNVGIGATAPQNKLQVVTTTRPQFSVSYNGTTGLYLEDATNSSWKSWKLSTSFGNGSDLSFVQSTNTSGTPTWAATAAMTLDASGNLGVGNTSPAARIDAFRSTVGTYFLGGGGDNVARQLAITSSTTTNSGDTHTFNAQSGTGVIAFATTGTERARFNTTGALVFAGGTTTANGIGITFPATQSASSNVNTLDDYEEGTWDPSFGGNSTLASSICTYTKVGRNVTLTFDFTIGTLGTGSTATISGLPFVNQAGAPVTGCVSYYAGLTISPIFIAFYIGTGTSQCLFVWNTAGASTVGFNANSLFQSNSRVIGSISYPTST